MADKVISELAEVVNICSEDSVHRDLSKKIDELSKSNELGNITNNDDFSLQRQVELGEITPFEVNARKEKASSSSESTFDATTGLLDLEKYLKRQGEIAAKRKLNCKVLNKAPTTKTVTNNKNVKSSRKITENPQKALRKKRKKSSTSQISNKSDAVESINVDDDDYQESVQAESGSEYAPSSDESEELYCPRPTKRKKKSQGSRDDGDESNYHTRLSKLAKSSINPSGSDLKTISNLFKLPRSIWKRLYPYQRVALRWLWELHTRSLGGLLGDEMGLGKTIQVIAFLAGLDCSELLSDGGRFRGLGPTLIVCPATLLEQWVDHFHLWYPSIRVATLHKSGSHQGSAPMLLESLKTGGILITSYSGVLRNSDTLIPYKWHYVILDEGHKIRNPQAKITKVLKQISTPHRLLLTGSPMQNSLKELWSLFDFILPGKLGTLDAFVEHCATPITKGGYANASTLQEATALQVATMLKDAITPYMLRRTKADVQHHLALPEKNEQVLFCSLTEEQTRLYKDYLISENVTSILHEKSTKMDGKHRAKMLVAVTALRKICNHPDLYTYGNRQVLEDFDDQEDETEEEDIDENIEIEKFGYWKKSGKMAVVRSLLKIWKKQAHRVLIFTQGRQMMHVLEALAQREEYRYLRLDGTTPMAERQKSINLFNSDASYFIFISTTRVGGLGVNLTGANRVIIYDPDWNPATDAQARERAWRIGQEKNVTIYRLISAGTIEEKIYHRQIFKLLLSNKVLDDPRQRRLFQTSDLSELFHLNEPIDGNSTESDRLFKNSIVKKKKEIKEKSEVSAIFEGERVFHLLGRRLAKSGEDDVLDDDNYVLNKLFAKTGINSAMVHDTVLASAKFEGHTSTPVHKLAKETAQESMDFLRQSRKWCWKPSWDNN